MRASAQTTASAGEILRAARERFGPSGAGLQLEHIGMLDASFRGGAGFVALSIEPKPGRGNTVIVETRELDDEVLRFLRGLPRRHWTAAPRRWLRMRR
jgi:hypothetical protein